MAMSDDERAGCCGAVLFAAGCLLWGAIWLAFGECVTSEGYRDGHVQKVSRQGVIWKTWEGELATAGLRNHGDAASNTWLFTIPDAAVAERLRAAPGDRLVRLRYKKVFAGLPWNGETSYRVVAVEEPGRQGGE